MDELGTRICFSHIALWMQSAMIENDEREDASGKIYQNCRKLEAISSSWSSWKVWRWWSSLGWCLVPLATLMVILGVIADFEGGAEGEALTGTFLRFGEERE